MRIIYWSSDVCSSDLPAGELQLVPLAAGDVHMATRRQRVLQDTITAIRHGLPLAECGAHLFRNGERHLRTRRALANIHASVAGGQALLAAAVELARRSEKGRVGKEGLSTCRSRGDPVH